MAEQIKKYVLTVCYGENDVDYETRHEFYASDDYNELENLYKFSKAHKPDCIGCSLRNAKGKLLFAYVGKKKVI